MLSILRLNAAVYGRLDKMFIKQIDGIPIMQCYFESHQIWMFAEHDNIEIKVPFNGGENSINTAG